MAGEIVEGEDGTLAIHLERLVRGRASGVEARFEYWCVVSFRDGRQIRSRWFSDREQALRALAD